MVFNLKDPFLCRVQRFFYVRINDSFAINKSGSRLRICAPFIEEFETGLVYTF